ANDTAPNNLYRNRGDGTFEDVAVEAGVAVDEAGRARGAMGVAWADTKNGSGTTLAIGNFSNELKSLYWTNAGDVFLDESPRSGVGPTSLLSLTFGLFFFDADLDGRLDLFLANGHVEPTVQQVQKDVAYKQPPLLYLNRGDDRYAIAASEGLAVPLVARGAAFADLDGDGDIDIVVVENGGPARVFVNRADHPERAVRIRLVGTGKSNRDAVGARAKASIAGRLLSQQVTAGSSYLSAPEKVLTFGLGSAAKIDRLEIRWPDGATESFNDIPGGSRLTIEQGKGIRKKVPAVECRAPTVDSPGPKSPRPMSNFPPAANARHLRNDHDDIPETLAALDPRRDRDGLRHPALPPADLRRFQRDHRD